MNSILDAAIGVAIVFAVFALIVSGLQELLASVINLRGRQLLQALEAIEGGKLAGLLDKPLLAPLQRTTSAPLAKKKWASVSSYVPSNLFAKSVLAETDLGKIAKAASEGTNPGDATKQLEDDLGGPMASVVTSLWVSGENDLGKLETAVAGWYDGYMERVSGWYKRTTRWIMLLLALLVALVGNVDAAFLTRQVVGNADVRAALVQDATTIRSSFATTTTQPASSTTTTTTTPPGGATGQTAVAPCDPSTPLTCAQQDVASLPGAQLQLFWAQTKTCTHFKDVTGNGTTVHTCTESSLTQRLPHGATAWFWKIFGLLLGAFAISLGAPFWFDLIGRGVSLRSSGPAPATAAGAPAPVTATINVEQTPSPAAPAAPAVVAPEPPPPAPPANDPVEQPPPPVDQPPPAGG